MRTQDGSERTARTMAAMNRQLDHMVRLIDDLLDVSRISRGLMDLKRESVDLSALAQATVDGTRPWFERRKQSLVVEIAERIYANADPTRFAQIITNLLHNANKFTPEGGSVRVSLERRGERAVLRVTDTGMGVRSDQVERVFQMFARVDAKGAKVQSGLGIGLALARRLAQMHGGSLELWSEGEGRGTTLTLEVPASTSSAVPARSSQFPRVEANGSPPLGIVVVEDNDDVANVLLEWLEGLGHRVTVARTGEHGLVAIRDHRPDLVICDLGLPELGGLDVCRHVRTSREQNQPTMVALTGWGREEDLRMSKEAGFDYHLVKPVAPEALKAVIQKVSEGLLPRPA
jgi:CheY-like chemotaxis protein